MAQYISLFNAEQSGQDLNYQRYDITLLFVLYPIFIYWLPSQSLSSVVLNDTIILISFFREQTSAVLRKFGF